MGGDLVSATNPLGATTTRLVDGAGRIVAMTDALGRVTRTTFNKLNHITQLTDQAGGQTVFQHDQNGRVLSRSDPLTHATTYTYDASDRVATRTDPLQKTAHYGYDGNGNLILQVDRSGQVTRYEYDPLDRVRLVTYADGSTKEYVYDVGNRQWKVIDSVGGTITRQYDGLDHLTNETSPEGSVSYTYDADGRRATMTVLGQQVVTYGYDDAHRLTSITKMSSAVEFTYDNADRQATVVLPNGIVTTYGYDNADRLTSLTYSSGQTTVGTLTYAYDVNGQRTSIGGTWAATGLPQALLSATYDAADRIAMWEGRAFGHDQNGNLTGDGLTSYTWSPRNQLVSVTGAANGSFVYDGSERRRAKTIEGTTTQFLYDGLNPVQELNSGTPTATLLTGLGADEYFARTDAGGVRNYLRDALGSSVALSDGSGTIQTKYGYEPFGAVTASGDATTNAYAFTGREDDGLGLTFLRARYYSPAYGRFISEDPIGFSGGANVYAYVHGDPVNYTDRLGLEPPDREEMARAVWNLGGVANAALAFALSEKARNIATASGLPDPGNGAQDAFRHCLWSCFMADALGERASKLVGDEHENAGDRRGQLRTERLMDEANNEAGRQCAAERRMGGRKDEDPPECKDLCFDRLVKGQLFDMGGKPLPGRPWTKPKEW
jgi:RHS repeat-associated protein